MTALTNVSSMAVLPGLLFSINLVGGGKIIRPAETAGMLTGVSWPKLDAPFANENLRSVHFTVPMENYDISLIWRPDDQGSAVENFLGVLKSLDWLRSPHCQSQ